MKSFLAGDPETVNKLSRRSWIRIVESVGLLGPVLAVATAIVLAWWVVSLPRQGMIPLAAAAAGVGMLALVAGKVVPRPHPGIGLALLVAAVPLRSLLEGSIAGLRVGITEPIALLALFWMIAFRRPGPLHLSRLLIVAGLFFGYVAISASWAAAPDQSMKEVAKWGQVAIALVVTMDLARRPADLKPVALAAGLVVGAEALFAGVRSVLAVGPESFRVGGIARAYGTFEQPNPFAGYLAMHLPFALAAFTVWRGKRRWASSIVVGLILAVIVLSLSRGAWLAGIAGSLTVFWLAGRYLPLTLKRMTLAVVLVAATLLLFAGRSVAPGPALSVLSGEKDVIEIASNPGDADFAITQRIAFWVAGARMVADRPLTGVGAGNFDESYPDYNIGIWGESLGHAHNLYLNLAAETGLIGAGLFVVFLAGVLAKAVRFKPKSQLEQMLLYGAAGSLIAFSIHNLVDSMFVGGLGIIFGVSVGLVLALSAPEPVDRVRL